jgi:hypothetical protein
MSKPTTRTITAFFPKATNLACLFMTETTQSISERLTAPQLVDSGTETLNVRELDWHIRLERLHACFKVIQFSKESSDRAGSFVGWSIRRLGLPVLNEFLHPPQDCDGVVAIPKLLLHFALFVLLHLEQLVLLLLSRQTAKDATLLATFGDDSLERMKVVSIAVHPCQHLVGIEIAEQLRLVLVCPLLRYLGNLFVVVSDLDNLARW